MESDSRKPGRGNASIRREVANDLVPAVAYRTGESKFVDGGFEDDLIPQRERCLGGR